MRRLRSRSGGLDGRACRDRAHDHDVFLRQEMHKARSAPRQMVGDEIRMMSHESGNHLATRIALEAQIRWG
jgi:hypothetical protein